MAIATIQHRRGTYGQFDKTKMLPAEFAVVLSGDPDVPSGKALYLAFASGDVHRLISIEDLEEMVRQDVFKGDKGDKGDTGAKGDKGASVNGANIDDRGHLMISLDDGTEYDSGPLDEAFALIEQAITSASEATSASQTAQDAAKQTAADRAATQQAKTDAETAAKNAADSERTAGEHAKTASDAADTATGAAGDAETAKSDAETAAGNAQQSETAAQGYADTASTAADTATAKASEVEQAAETVAVDKQAADKSATDAEAAAKLAQSYANGESGSREGEESDNAKEYARQAAESAKEAAGIVGGDFVTHNEVGKPGGVASLDETGKVPEAQIPGFEPKSFTLSAEEWSGLEAPYLYAIPLEGVNANRLVLAAPASGLSAAEKTAFMSAVISEHDQQDGQVTLEAMNKPEINLPIVLLVGGQIGG